MPEKSLRAILGDSISVQGDSKIVGPKELVDAIECYNKGEGFPKDIWDKYMIGKGIIVYGSPRQKVPLDQL